MIIVHTQNILMHIANISNQDIYYQLVPENAEQMFTSKRKKDV